MCASDEINYTLSLILLKMEGTPPSGSLASSKHLRLSRLVG